MPVLATEVSVKKMWLLFASKNIIDRVTLNVQHFALHESSFYLY